MRMVQIGLVAASFLGLLTASAQAQTAPQYGPQRATGQPGAQPTQNYGPQPPAGYGAQSQSANQTPGAAATPPGKPSPPPVPFVLTPEQQAALDQVLAAWEQRSDKVKTFKCQFNRWDYNATFGPPKFSNVLAKGRGEIKFKAPDHGVYRVAGMTEWDSKVEQYVDKKEGLDHWVCNGQSIFEFQTATRQLIERKLPPQMRGKAISDGPLPFIFGANAATLKRRYLMREFTPADAAAKEIWLEAYPRFQTDAANFQRVEFILTRDEFLPYALQIYLPMGKDRTVYQFTDIKINGSTFLDTDFAAPRTPFGWKKVQQDPSTPPKQPPFQPVDQVQRPPATQQK